MGHFNYKNNELYCESVRISKIVKEVGTPCYIYSYNSFIDRFREIKQAFKALDPLVCFAMKSNDNLAVVKALSDAGAGFDIVSEGELKKALKVKADPRRIVFASVGKTDEEITAAIKAGILFFNAESLPEVENINRIAKALNKKAQVALRINPDIDAITHDKITTGTLDKKFGIDLKTAKNIILANRKYSNLKINGIHMHIGSQITSVQPYIKAIKKAASFVSSINKDIKRVEYLNIGGGIGIKYHDEKTPSIDMFAKAIIPILSKLSLKLIIEPGRFISGNAGVFITKTLYLKDNGVKKFLIVDAGMSDLSRPSLYDAYHEIIPVKKTSAKKIKVDIVGPICESGDFFAQNRLFQKVKTNDLIAIMSAGAYCYVMASNYNVRGRAAEVMVRKNKFCVVKKRETFKDLIKGESIPEFLK